MVEQQNKTDIVGTTDSFEAVKAFKTARNLLFIISIVCLLLTQAAFLLDHFGYIDRPCPAGIASVAATPTPADHAQAANDGKTDTTPQAKGVEDTANNKQAKDNDTDTPKSETSADNKPAPTAAKPKDSTKKMAIRDIGRMLTPTIQQACYLVRTCNFVLVLAVTLYSLILLICLKISLMARLGGINHISKAFILSLVAVVVVIPWQTLFPGVLTGAIYLPDELFSCGASCACCSTASTVCLYIRFSGLWLIEVLFLVLAQIRCVRWSKATLRRLGIIC